MTGCTRVHERATMNGPISQQTASESLSVPHNAAISWLLSDNQSILRKVPGVKLYELTKKPFTLRRR